jgi:cyclopropane fatty-acyl-phospholipid synthase-like methyltransferase
MGATRRDWLAERRAAVVATYDLEAPTYDEHEYPTALQARFVGRLVDSCPVGGIVLDAPCGTGRYFAQVTEKGRRVFGIDQSSKMLEQARQKKLADGLEQVALQDLAFVHAFDAAMTIDAMENVSPEDWPTVLANLHRAVRPGAHLFLTVEEIDEGDIESAFVDMQQRGLPAVRGEVIEGDVAGYHYYPGRAQVLTWLATEGLEVVEEDFEQQAGWGYRHLLVR